MTVWQSAKYVVYPIIAGVFISGLYGCSSSKDETAGKKGSTLSSQSSQSSQLTKVGGDYGFLPSSKSIPTSEKFDALNHEIKHNYFKSLAERPNPNENQNEAGKPKMIAFPSGLRYVDLEEGWGNIPESGGMTMLHYTGWLENGTKFDSSLDKHVPFQFRFGHNEVIIGLEEGISNMKVGGTRKIIVPPQLAYGKNGLQGKIPPNSTLVYKIRLLSTGKQIGG